MLARLLCRLLGHVPDYAEGDESLYPPIRLVSPYCLRCGERIFDGPKDPSRAEEITVDESLPRRKA